MFLAFWLEFRLSKREILKLYLDRAYMGGGTFGVQAAADFYFKKSVKDVRSPKPPCWPACSRRRRNSRRTSIFRLRARAADVLANLVDAGFMTPSQTFAALRNPATAVDRDRDNSPDWYLDWAYSEEEARGSRQARQDRVLTVRVAFDLAPAGACRR